MLRVLSMYNNISRLPPVLILFVSVAIVTTSNAKSSEALDFGETSVAASRLTEKLEHSLQYKNRNCSISNNNNNNLTSLVCTAGTAAAAEVDAVTGQQILSRRKRYLAFPVGSSFSCAVCLSAGVLGNPNYQYLSVGVNWGFAYDLANATWVLDHVHALGRKKSEKVVEVVEEPTIKRRHRRDLYHKVETILKDIPLPLLDYRLIAINALIYDLIASEIVNVNAHIVIAATDMTEFDKSATMGTTCTTTKILRLTHERQREALKSPTTRRSTTMSNADKAELAFFGQKSRHASDHVVLGDNNSLSDRNIGFTLLANGKGISLPITPQTPATPTSDDVVVSIIAARTFDMMTDDSSRFANSFNVIPTINERVDNFRNDKKQIASTTMTGVVTAARTAAALTAKAEVRVDSEQPAIKVRVITAIKSAATQFTTSASQPSVLISASTIPARTSRVSTHATQPVTSATPAQTTKAATTSKATITMSKLLTTTTAAATTGTTTMETRAMPWWPTLHGHDLLSSTNVMPNCRVTPECACAVQCHATTNSNTRTRTTYLAFVESSRAIKTAAATAAALTPSSPSSTSSPSSSIPTTPVLTAKVQATTATATATPTAEARASQQSWSTAHVTKSGGTKLSPSNNNSAAFNANSNKKKLATATSTTKAAQTLSEFSAARPIPTAMRCSTTSTTNLTATETTTATTTAKSKASKSTAALQLHWQRVLSRQKRYLAFPEGSSFSVSLCITVGIIGNPNYNYMSYGLNWGVSYDLPNATWVLNQLHGLSRRPMPEAVLYRRSKRALYERIGEAVDNMGYNGRECVLRALCESRQYFARNKMSMIGEMLRVIFSLPKQRLFTRELRENSEILAYDHAYRKARTVNCATHYDCSFSLLELAFGKYARPPTDYYNKFGM